MITDKHTGQAFLSLWFGNFYRPAYDDRDFICQAMSLIKDLGFNTILLDSKAWEDFQERFQGKDASPYVAIQEFMMEEATRHNLSYEFLSLYLNGDNLYPHIRFSPPVYGDSVVNADGSDGKWYRYWSEKAKDSMAQHVQGLMKLYGSGQAKILADSQERLPICSMWDPIVAPSFDDEGRERYIGWLKARWHGSIEDLNKAYGLNLSSFAQLNPEEYWFSLRWPDRASFTEEEVSAMAPPFRVLSDNRMWQRDELCSYFQDMKERLHHLDPRLWLCPDLAQWGYFLNVDGAMLSGVGMADLWDTAVRGIDLYRLADYVDCANFLSVPVTPAGDPDIYVTACHHSMMRAMNRGREFLGGIYWGRFLYNHLYEVITPCETVAAIAASGAKGYNAYGMCGLDDGGVLHRMEPCFNESLKRANEWFQEILPLTGSLLPPKIAILFPSAMALCENMQTPGNKERRLDLLGWYRGCLDLGMEADVTDGKALCRPEIISQYQVIILPEDDCYPMEPDAQLEQALLSFVKGGGTLVHSPGNRLAIKLFTRNAVRHAPSPADLGENCLVQSTCWCSYRANGPGETVLAAWLPDGAPAAVRRQMGKGCVYSLGFDYGFSLTAKVSPHVPREQKNNELYPLPMIKRNLLQEILEQATGTALSFQKNIRRAEFTGGLLVINHSSYPCRIREEGKKYFQYPVDNALLLPRSAVFIAK